MKLDHCQHFPDSPPQSHSTALNIPTTINASSKYLKRTRLKLATSPGPQSQPLAFQERTRNALRCPVTAPSSNGRDQQLRAKKCFVGLSLAVLVCVCAMAPCWLAESSVLLWPTVSSLYQLVSRTPAMKTEFDLNPSQPPNPTSSSVNGKPEPKVL